MDDRDCTAFLQWALPRLGLRWAGYRKVRKGVCKRIARRCRELGLGEAAAYRARLEADPGEWEALAGLCRVSISRFFRDRGVWDRLGEEVLPGIARARGAVRAWSAGCASGEEPYSLALLWRLSLRARFPAALAVTATDADPRLLARARRGAYRASSLKELPADWRAAAFEEKGGEFILKDAFRGDVAFLPGDVRREAPPGAFDLILCRNLAFTYFDAAGQRAAFGRLRAALAPGGFLVLGAHEALPEGGPGFAPLAGEGRILRQEGGKPLLARGGRG